MKTITMTELRRDWDKIVAGYVAGSRERILVTRYGKLFFGIVGAEDFDLLESADPQEVTP